MEIIPSTIIQDPLGTLFLTFLIGSLRYGPVFLGLLSLITSVITYPFIFIGKWMLKRPFEELELEDLKKWQKELIIVISLSLIFWILVRAWYALAGSSFVTDIPGFLVWVLITGFIAYLIYSGAKKAHSKFTERWTMPNPLSYFVMDYGFNLIMWVILYILIIVISLESGTYLQ